MNKEEVAELFIRKPSLKQYYGRTVTKDTTFDETTDTEVESHFGKVHQTLKDLVLITEADQIQEWNGIKSTIHTEIKQELPEGQVLIWNELQGYTIPQDEIYKLRDLEQDIADVKEIYKDNKDINPE